MGARRPAGPLRLRAGGETLDLILGDPRAGNEERPGDRSRLVSELHRQLLPLAPAERCHILAQVHKWAGEPPVAQDIGRSLTAAEVQQLAGDLVDIGAHTVSHPLLAAQPIAVQRAEIRDGKSALEALLGRPVTGFSYPNGSVSPTTRALVQEAGFQHACGSQSDGARKGSHRYQLPRLWVPDCDGDAFARLLHRCLLG